MRFGLIGCAALLAATFMLSPRLSLDFARIDDPAPRRFEIAAELAGAVIRLAVRWSVPQL
jgi:hypothetical protein